MKKILTLGTVLLTPFLTFAQQPDLDTGRGIYGALEFIQDFINVLIPILVGIAVLIIIWGVVVWITKAGDPEARKEGAKKIITGIIGIVIIVGIWGLVNILVNTFNLDENSDVNIPTVPGPGDAGDDFDL